MPKSERIYNKIQEIQEREQTVVLTLAQGDQVVAIHFQDGQISAVSTNNPQFRLGRFFKEAGILDDAGVNEIVREARQRRTFFGQAAVEKGLIDIDALVELIQEQAVRIMMPVLKEKFQVRSIGQELIEYYLPARMDLHHLMLLIARKTVESFPMGTNQLIVMKSSLDLTHLPWYPEELAVMGLLESPRRIEEVLTMTGFDETCLGKILSVFDALGLIEIVDAPSEATTAIVKRNGFPFASLVPQIPIANVNAQMEALLRPASFASEQFKTLKVRLSGILLEGPVRVITVTSPEDHAGKSLLSANLAVSFSRDPERKTIIIDGDMRKPTLHTYVGASLEPGLIGYLQDDRLQSFCYMRRLENLFIMTGGGRTTASVELLCLEKMRSFIEYLRSEFDTIIIDAPPLAPISDAQILAGLSDGVVLVVRSGQTSYTAIERAVKNLDEAKLLGVVLNDVPPLMFNTQDEPNYYGHMPPGQYPYGTPETKIPKHRRSYLD